MSLETQERVSAAAPVQANERSGLYRYLATSNDLIPRLVRQLRKGLYSWSVPAPKLLVKPALWVYLLLRTAYYFFLRVFICEPLFKAYLTRCGKRFRADCYIPWISGKGDIILGDDVAIEGKFSLGFACRFSDRPTLRVGDNSRIGHGCAFTIGRQITIGKNCSLSGDILISDSNGHSTDPESRLARRPPSPDEVRPVTIGDGVWIGRKCIIFPGVRIGEGTVISAGSIVRSHAPPYSVVAGNPAKVVFRLRRSNPPASEGTAADPVVDADEPRVGTPSA
ncbi:MAG: acyltransferase [Planctomycetales bacterium]